MSDTPSADNHNKTLKLPSNKKKILTLYLILTLNRIRFCLFLLKAFPLYPRFFFKV